MIFTRFLCVLALLASVAQAIEHLILIGNPGSGKSTILNSLIGQVVFSSGVSLGTGRTKVMQTHVSGLVKYSDTPGLDDIRSKEAAAKQIEELLTGSDNIKLVFVITLENWRVKPADVATIKVVLDSLGQGDMTNKFTVLINQASNELASVLTQGGEVFELFKNDLFRSHRTDFILFQDRELGAFEKEGVLIDVSEFKQELHKLPYISIDKSKLVPIDVKSIETVRQEAYDALQRQKDHYEDQLRIARESKPKRKRGLVEKITGAVKDVVGIAAATVNVVGGAVHTVNAAAHVAEKVLDHTTNAPKKVLNEAKRFGRKLGL